MQLGEIKVLLLETLCNNGSLGILSFKFILNPKKTCIGTVFWINAFDQIFPQDVFIALADIPRLVRIFIRDAGLYLLRLEESSFGLIAPFRFFVVLLIILSEEWRTVFKNEVWC
jgi:hypothetical protein